jgi:hypothetical protein
MIPIPPSPTYLEIQESVSHIMIKANSVFCKCSCENITLDEKFLSFHSMRDLMYLEITGCYNLLSISLRTFGHLISLKTLKIRNSSKIIYSDEDLVPSNAGALPSLESLHISWCKITGKWLSMMLRHSPTLKKLLLRDCPLLTQLQVEEDENIQPNLTSAWEASPTGYCLVTRSAPNGLCRIPLNLTSSLREITMSNCPNLIFDKSREDLAGFTSLEKFEISGCPKLLSSLVHNDGQEDGRWLLPQSLEKLFINFYHHETLRPCFVDNITHLKKIRSKFLPRFGISTARLMHGDEMFGDQPLQLAHCTRGLAMPREPQGVGCMYSTPLSWLPLPRQRRVWKVFVSLRCLSLPRHSSRALPASEA